MLLEGDNLFESAARAPSPRDNLVFVHPYEDPLIIAGQHRRPEMLEAAGPEVLVVPGGGGLISGSPLR